jgi:quinol-cytochrome oxidoreductase complex cytochrome b subunit
MPTIALSVTGAAWILTVAVLVLDLLGRPLARRNLDVRVRRRELTAGFALITVVVLTQVSVLGNWPRPLRGSLDLVDMLAALVFLVCVLATLSSRQGKSQQP